MAKKVPAANPTVRKARLKQIVEGRIQQKTTTEIAAGLGISRQMVNYEERQPENQELIRSWMQPHHKAIQRMIPRALSAVNKGLKPSNEMRDRLNAVKTLGNVMQWAEGSANDGNSGNSNLRWQGQLEELLVLYRRVTAEAPDA